MAYFAEIENGIVKRVIVADLEFINSGKVGDPQNWVETFIDGSQRKSYASIGYTYNKIRDVFITPKPYPSWVLDVQTNDWYSPKPMPVVSVGQSARWSELKNLWEIFNL